MATRLVRAASRGNLAVARRLPCRSSTPGPARLLSARSFRIADLPADVQAAFEALEPSPIVAFMTAHAGSAEIAEQCCAALCSIADIMPMNVVRARAPAAIVAAMAAHASSARVAEQGCKTLRIIAAMLAGLLAAIAALAPEAIVAAMATHAGCATVTRQGCWALCEIAKLPVSRFPAAFGGAQAAVDARAPAAIVAANGRAHKERRHRRAGLQGAPQLRDSARGRASGR